MPEPPHHPGHSYMSLPLPMHVSVTLRRAARQTSSFYFTAVWSDHPHPHGNDVNARRFPDTEPRFAT
jgi:hypothetical protein